MNKVLPACITSISFRGRQWCSKDRCGDHQPAHWEIIPITSFITEATQHLLPKITSLGLILTLQVIQIHDWLPLCYLQNSNKYIKKIYWLCDKADHSQLIKLVSESFSRKEKNPFWGSLSCCAVWYNSSLFFPGSKIQQKKLIKSLLREKRRRKKEVSLYRPPQTAPSHRRRDGEF